VTVAELRDRVARVAGGLAERGVGKGDAVATISENRIEVLEVWLACAWLGALHVPVNTALRGRQLEHVLGDSQARLVLREDDLDGLARVNPVEPVEAAPGDTCVLLYTSGTTGPAKGVLCPHAQWYWWGVVTGEMLGVTADDVLYTCLPLFHTNAMNAFMQALVAGAVFVPGPRFSASRFWRRIVDADATVTYLLGAMVHILANREPEEHERMHRVRVALAPATPASLVRPFADRFGIELIDSWGSTETNAVISTSGGGAPAGSMGAVTAGFDARVVDEDDEEVARGTPGELIVRSSYPFAFATGYLGLPEKTLAAWRNQWVHTGDRVTQDAAGWFWFVDRLKDSIRRRGENISSYEVEAALTEHPNVAAAAAVPVPSELGEDEVLAVVVPREGTRLDPAELVSFCEPRLASFAIPRYVEIVDELPLTSNGKVEKYKLRERGVSATTWDRERLRSPSRRSP
jgi:crotonobetaine/carnitine-CoA ligase